MTLFYKDNEDVKYIKQTFDIDNIEDIISSAKKNHFSHFGDIKYYFIAMQFKMNEAEVSDEDLLEYSDHMVEKEKQIAKAYKNALDSGVSIEDINNLNPIQSEGLFLGLTFSQATSINNKIQIKALQHGANYDQAIQFEGIGQFYALEDGATPEQALSFKYMTQINHFSNTHNYCESFKRGFRLDESLVLPEECIEISGDSSESSASEAL